MRTFSPYSDIFAVPAWTASLGLSANDGKTGSFSATPHGTPAGIRVKTVEKTREKLLDAIKSNPKITQKELAEATGLTRRGIEWNLKELKKKGLLRRIGPDKGGHWEILTHAA